MVEVYIGLGSNIDRPVDQLTRAFSALHRLPSTRLVDRSALYRSRPHGPPNQPDYINAVAALITALAPLTLLRHLQAMERRHRRVRTQKWGPRTLDLDIIIYGKTTLRHPRLTIPHPLLHRREFVLVPLAGINPDLKIPGNAKVKTLMGRLDRRKKEGLHKLL